MEAVWLSVELYDLLTDGVRGTVAICVPLPLFDLDVEEDNDKVFVVERDCDGIGVFDVDDEPILLILAVWLDVIVSTADTDLVTDKLAVFDRLAYRDRVTLRDVVTEIDILAGMLCEPLDVGYTDGDGVRLNPNDCEREGLASFEGDTVIDLDLVLEIVTDTAVDGDAENEQDLNNGLHDRVTLTDGARLRETLMLGD